MVSRFQLQIFSQQNKTQPSAAKAENQTWQQSLCSSLRGSAHQGGNFAAQAGYWNANAVKYCPFLSVISKNGEEIKHKNSLKQSSDYQFEHKQPVNANANVLIVMGTETTSHPGHIDCLFKGLIRTFS